MLFTCLYYNQLVPTSPSFDTLPSTYVILPCIFPTMDSNVMPLKLLHSLTLPCLASLTKKHVIPSLGDLYMVRVFYYKVGVFS